jgi:hypothetical protein
LSHIVQIQTEVRDSLAVRAACGRLELAEPVHGTHKLFSNQEATGLAVQLPGWRYPLVCDTATGQLQFDNYSGHWGDPKQLDRFLQSYATEKVRLEAHRQGHSVTEQLLADGSVKLTIQVTGGAP